MSRIALPPGIYRIVMGTQAVTSPSTHGAALTIAVKNNSSAQQWQISANGRFTPMNAPGNHAWMVNPSVTGTSVTRSNLGYDWIINASMDTGGVISGWIMTNDTRKGFWGLTGTNVILVANATSWVFEPVPVV